MTREEALKLIQEKVKTKNLVKHMIAVEACMRKLAERLGEDPEMWGLAGLLHDIDYEVTKDKPEEHAKVGAEWLREMGLPEEIVNAVRRHAGRDEKPVEPMDIALYAADPLTGLIVASALMHPSRSLKGMDRDFVLRRFKEKRFAAGANREQIKECERLGLSLEEFIDICLEAMKEVSDALGL